MDRALSSIRRRGVQDNGAEQRFADGDPDG
jgi:hypothetical protein